MTSFKAFNSMLSEFLGELADTFDEYQSVSDARTLVDGMISMNGDTDVPMKMFVEVLRPHSALLAAKDKALFDVCKIPMVSDSGFDMSKEWPTLEEDDQEVIWNYLGQLYMIGSTISGLDKEVVSTIEGIARGCIDKVESGEMSEEDAKNPMIIFQEIMKNKELMASFGVSMDGSEDMNQMDIIRQMMGGSDNGDMMDMVKQMMGNM